MTQALLKRGLPRKPYVDNGPAFRSTHLQEITTSLGIALIHSKPYKPQGRGKIERFFQTVQRQFLPGFRVLMHPDCRFIAILREGGNGARWPGDRRQTE